MSKQALILIDLQHDYFANGLWPLDNIEPAAANAARVLAAFRQAGKPVIHVRHESLAADAPFFRPGTPGAQIHGAVAPAANEPVIVKHYPNSFRETELHAVLAQQGIESLVLVGAMSHMCIEAAGRAAADLGYRVTVLHDACATRELVFDGHTVPAAQVHAGAMAALAFGYAQLLATEAFLAQG